MSRNPRSRGDRPRVAPACLAAGTLARFAATLLVTLVLSGLATAQPLTVLVHDSFAISEDVLATFTERTGIDIQILPAGDAGAVVNRAILTRDNPIADLLYGVDNSLIGRAADRNLFVPYRSPALDDVPSRFVFDPEHRVTPVDVGYVNFNWDKAYFAANDIQPPTDIAELTEPAYRGLTVVTDPTSSSPGLAFMLATIAKFGEGGEYDWLDYWADLRSNDLLVASGWSDAYYSAFTRYGGDRPIVLSYATSPAAEVIFADEPLDEAPTANLFCESCVWRQIEAVGILSGTDRLEDARAFVDFMLSDVFQSDIPLNMFVYPVVSGVELPQEFDRFAPVPAESQVADLSTTAIFEHQQRWLEQWTQVVQQGRSPDAVR